MPKVPKGRLTHRVKPYNKNNKGKANVGQGSEFGGQSRGGFSATPSLDLRSIPLFPAQARVMCRYVENVSATSTVGAVGVYTFSANGLYDPNITGTGHQPDGFDQMIASFEHYVVLNAKIMIIASNTTASVIPKVALSHRAASTAVSTWTQVLENGLVRCVQLLPFGVQGSIAEMELSANIAKFGGVSNLLDNPYYRGDISNNPLEQQYFHIQNVDDFLGVTNVCAYQVTIEYDCVFKEPRTLSQSLRRDLVKLIQAESKSSV